MDMGPIRAERDKLEERARAAESKAESLLSVNAVLRTQLAEATDQAATLRGQLAEAQERLRTVERHAREAQRMVEWVTHDDGRRTLIRRLIVTEELAEVGPSSAGPGCVSFAYADGRISGSGHHSDPTRDPEQAMQAAQRIVETLTGVRP